MSGSFGFRHLLKQRIPRYLDVKQRTTGLQDLPPVMGHYGKHTAATPSETHVRKLLKLTAQALLAAAAGHPEHLLGRGGPEEVWVASLPVIYTSLLGQQIIRSCHPFSR